MRKLVIVRGLPGSGKSMLSQKIIEYHPNPVWPYYYKNVMKCSTDDFFMCGDEYRFDGRKLQQAREWNISRVKRGISFEYELIIVDGTNTTFFEVSPYVEMGLHADYLVQFVEPKTEWAFDLDILFKLNLHNVPRNAIDRMLQRWQSTLDILMDCRQEFDGHVDYELCTIRNKY